MAASVSVALCQGFDRVLNRERGTAMKHERTCDSGKSAAMQYKVCKSLEEVKDMLQVEESAAFGILDIMTISEKASFIKSMSLTTHSVAIVVFAKQIISGEAVVDATLMHRAPNDEAAVKSFMLAYGDSYVTKIEKGAEYYGSFTYYSSTEEEKNSLLGSMQAQGIDSWESVQASIDAKIERFNASTNIRNEFRQQMTGADIELPDVSEMLSFARAFSSLDISKPKILRFESIGYEHAPRFPSALFQPIIRNRRLICEEPTFISNLSQVETLGNDVQAIQQTLSSYNMYEGSVELFLDQVMNAIEEDKTQLKHMIDGYEDNATQIVHCPTQFTSLVHWHRVLSSHWTEEPFVYFGSISGVPFDSVKTDVASFMHMNRRINSLQIQAVEYIEQIVIAYTDGDKVVCGRESGCGPLINPLYISDNDKVCKIHMQRDAEYITFLEFHLASGDFIANGPPPDPSKVGSPEDWTYDVPENLHFCGLQGHAGEYIAAVRPVIAKFVIN